MIVGLVIGLAILAAIGWRYLSAPAAADRAFERFVALCRGDREVADRLVAAEGQRRPNASRSALIAGAIDRLLADRRR